MHNNNQLNEISQKTLASYIEKSSKRLQDKKDKDQVKPLKGATASVTKSDETPASKLSDKLKSSGKDQGFLKNFQKKPVTTNYNFKGQQWVSDKGKIADKETGAKLTKQNIDQTGGHNKASERLKSIQQASKRLQDKTYQRQDKINSAKTKLNKFVAGVSKTASERTERDMPKLKKLGQDIKTGVKGIADKTARDMPKLKKVGQDIKTGAVTAYKVMKPHVQNALDKAKQYMSKKVSYVKAPKSSTTYESKKNSQDDIYAKHNAMVKAQIKAKNAMDKARLVQKTEKAMYRVPVHYKSKYLGRDKTEHVEVRAKNHFHALDKVNQMAKEAGLRNHRLGKHERIK